MEDQIITSGNVFIAYYAYTWQDYDFGCGDFYNGLYYLEEIL